MPLHELLRNLRLRRALTQRELSDISGVSDAQIRGLEQGISSNPTFRTAKQLADAFRSTLPFTPAEMADFCRLTRLDPAMLAGPGTVVAGLKRIAAETFSGQDSIGLARARESFARLLDAAGPQYTTAILDQAFSNFSARYQSPTSRPAPAPPPGAVAHHDPETGATIYQPANPATAEPLKPPSVKAKLRRRAQ